MVIHGYSISIKIMFQGCRNVHYDMSVSKMRFFQTMKLVWRLISPKVQF